MRGENSVNHKPRRPRRYPNLQRRSPLILMVILLLFLSVVLGTTASFALAPTPLAQRAALKSIDPVPPDRQLAAEVYRDQCGSCHLALPPEVLPTESWRQILMSPRNHYGVSLNLIRAEIILIWSYLRDFSRVTVQGEAEPYRVVDSRFFKALHPRVTFAEPPSPKNCATCHNRAQEFDFRSLTPEWLDAP